jgi:nucleoside-diphosphate-sugar epimerase
VTLLNLGSDQGVRLVKVAQTVLELTGSLSRVRFDDPDPGAVEPGLPDITRAREVLGWIPLVRVEDGLKRMIDFTKSHRNQITF